MTEEFKLPHPPIVEAVLDIDCELPQTKKLLALEEPAKAFFGDKYPKFEARLIQQHNIESKPDGPPAISVHQGLRAYRFFHEDGKQLIQVRIDGFSFNRLVPYTSLDDYLPEIERTWHLYLRLAAPIQIRIIRLRYINRILLPLKRDKVDLDEYFQVGPRLPDEKRLTFLRFLNQHDAVDVETGHLVTTVLTSEIASEYGPADSLPVIFDNCVASAESHGPDDWPWIENKILSLRALKNHVFKNSVTEKCLTLFR